MKSQNSTMLASATDAAKAITAQTPFYIQTAISRSPWDTNTRSVISKKNGIIIDNWSPGDNDQLWVFNENGTISPWDDASVVLTSQSTTPTGSTQITLEAVGSIPTVAQVWSQDNYHIWVEMGGSLGNLYLTLNCADTNPGTPIINLHNI